MNASPLARRLPADLLTPVGALLRLGDGDAFLFESVERGERIGRYSYVGTRPEWSESLSAAEFRARAREALGAAGAAPASAGAGGAISGKDDRLPRFVGGLVFALGWDYARDLEPRLGAPAGPVARAALFRDVVAFDHLRQEVTLLHAPAPGEPPEAGEAALAALAARLDRPLPGVLAGTGTGTGTKTETVKASRDAESFAGIVRRAKEYIAAGDVFQVVLSRRFERETPASGLAIYRALRMVNPSPYMFYLRLGGTEWAGASPEMLLRVEDGEAMTHPTAGTRRRGATEAEDLALAAELSADPKERAEHAMLVDLARNDLGRVSEGGSVRLTRHMEVERFSHVMHLVSEVRGRLRPGVDAIAALDACFPAGTVSGAPKVRAMEIIDELEGAPRGVYAGAVGAASFSGTLDACIAIRTVEVAGGVARWQAGAGVVGDSVPEREAEETREKAGAMARAIARAEAEL